MTQRAGELSSLAGRLGSGRRIKVAVVGNCQAGGISDALNIMDDNMHSMPFMVHTIPVERREAAFENLRKYDLILSQPIKSFGPLNTDSLRALGIPVITFPNVYFRGFHPDICFLGPGSARIRTPLANNNSFIILMAFLQGLSCDACLERFTPETYARYGYDTVWSESLEVLKAREVGIDLPISQVFEDQAHAPRMYVMNHPTMEVLGGIAKRTLEILGRNVTPVRPEIMPDRLRAGSIWPLYTQGNSAVAARDLRFKAAASRYMTLPEFIHASYRVYEATQRDALVVSSPDELAVVQDRLVKEGAT